MVHGISRDIGKSKWLGSWEGRRPPFPLLSSLLNILPLINDANEQNHWSTHTITELVLNLTIQIFFILHRYRDLKPRKWEIQMRRLRSIGSGAIRKWLKWVTFAQALLIKFSIYFLEMFPFPLENRGNHGREGGGCTLSSPHTRPLPSPPSLIAPYPPL